MELLADEVASDEYVRKLDLSHNKIPEEPIANAFIGGMRFNESLVNVDLKGNKGLTTDVKRQLALCLLKNLEIYKASGQAIKPTWIDMTQLEILDDQMKGFIQEF